MVFNVVGGLNEHKSRMIASTARREHLALYAGHFVFLYVSRIVGYTIDSGRGNSITGFVCFSHLWRNPFLGAVRVDELAAGS